MSLFFAVWALLLIALVCVLIMRGKKDKARMKKIEKDIRSVNTKVIKVNEVWERLK